MTQHTQGPWCIGAMESGRYAAGGANGVGQSIKPQVQADTAQKPVAWICAEWSGSGVPELSFDGPPQELSVRDELTRPVWTPLYAASQPARQPLTEDQVWASNKIMAVNADIGLSMVKLMMITRAIEAAHGII